MNSSSPSRTRRALAAALSVLALASCDPAAVTHVRLLRTPEPSETSGSSITVSTTEVEAVESIVRDLAIEHGLPRVADATPDTSTVYSRRWDYVGDGHPRVLTVTVEPKESGPACVEVIVFEWLSAGHSSIGKALLQDLRLRLRERFGATRVTG